MSAARLRAGIATLSAFMARISVLLEEKFSYSLSGAKCFFPSKSSIGGNLPNMGVNALSFIVIG